MKNLFSFLFALSLIILTGCTTITKYDKEGNIIEKQNITNFSRAMDGINAKSQMVLVDGILIGFEVSPSAGDAFTPGFAVDFKKGKVAVINQADTLSKFEGAPAVLRSFFNTSVSVSSSGVSVTDGAK